jgi:hypothetical protein
MAEMAASTVASENEKFFEIKAASVMSEHSEVSLDLEAEQASYLSSQDLQDIAHKFVYDHLGNRYELQELWSDFKTIFIFIRVLIGLASCISCHVVYLVFNWSFFSSPFSRVFYALHPKNMLKVMDERCRFIYNIITQ